MGRQVNFYLAPRDLREAERRIKGTGDVVYLALHSPTANARVVNEIESARYLVRPDDVAKIKLIYAPAQRYWAVDILDSPAIELRWRPPHGAKLQRGRLYFVTDYYDSQRKRHLKDQEFIRWADRLIAAVKKGLKRDKELGDYVGPEAGELRARAVVKFTTGLESLRRTASTTNNDPR